MKYTKDELIERLDKMRSIYGEYDDACNNAKELSLEEGFNTSETYYFGYNDAMVDSVFVLYYQIKQNSIDIHLTYNLLLYIFNIVTSSFDNTTFGNFLESVINDKDIINEIKLAFSK